MAKGTYKDKQTTGGTNKDQQTAKGTYKDKQRMRATVYVKWQEKLLNRFIGH